MSRALVSPEQVAEIIQMSDGVARNHAITQSYHDLSQAIRLALGDSKNANWSTFAAWASCTAGQSIRGEDLPRWGHQLLAQEQTVQRHLGGVFGLVMRLTGVDLNLLDNAREALTEVSHQVAAGNLEVYEELGPEFSKFVEMLSGATAEAEIDRFFEGLLPGSVEQRGQDLLWLAFRNYLDARDTSDANRKAELMLLGNCRIGLHEQTRLQGFIERAINAPLVELMTDVLLKPPLIRGALEVARVFGVTREQVEEIVSQQWEAGITRYAMNLALPEGKEIALSGEVAWPRPPPTELEHLEHPELIQLRQRFTPLEELRSRGADNWTDLGDRMGFIIALFRSQQQNETFFQAPPQS